MNVCLHVSAVMSSSLQLTPNGLDLATESSPRVVVSLPEDILDNYKEAVINYSKVYCVLSVTLQLASKPNAGTCAIIFATELVSCYLLL